MLNKGHAAPMHSSKWGGVTPVLTFLLIAALVFAPAAAFSGSGAGTSGDPYQITTYSQFNEITASLSSYYKLMNDISFSSTCPSTNNSAFTGTLYGNNKNISDITCTGLATTDLGMIKGGGGKYYNFALQNVKIAGTAGSWGYGGILCGHPTTGFTAYNITIDSRSYLNDTGSSANAGLGSVAGRCESGNCYMYNVSSAAVVRKDTGTGSNVVLGGLAHYNNGAWGIYYSVFNGVITAASTHKDAIMAYVTSPAGTTCTGVYYNTGRYTVEGSGCSSGSPVGLSDANAKLQASYANLSFSTTQGYKMSSASGYFLGYPISYFAEAGGTPTATIDWTNPTALNRTSQEITWSSSYLSSPYRALMPPNGTWTPAGNLSIAASSNVNIYVDQVGTWTVYIQDGATPSSTLDSDTITVVQNPYGSVTWGIYGPTVYNISTATVSWSAYDTSHPYLSLYPPNATFVNWSVGATGTQNIYIDQRGDWVIRVQNGTIPDVVIDDETTLSHNQAALSMSVPGPFTNMTVQSLTYSSYGVVSPYYCILPPNSTWINTTKAVNTAYGGQTISLDSVGSWSLYMMEGDPGTTPDPYAAYSDTFTVTEVTETGTVNWADPSATTGTNEIYTWTYSGIPGTTHFINISTPTAGVWDNSSVTGASGGGSKVLTLLGTYNIYLMNNTHVLQSDAILVSDVPAGDVQWGHPTAVTTVVNQSSVAYEWIMVTTSNPYLAICNPSGSCSNTSRPLSGDATYTINAIGAWKIYCQNNSVPSNPSYAYDSATLTVGEVTEVATFSFSSPPNRLLGTAAPYTWTYTGINGATHFINMSLSETIDGVLTRRWDNSTSPVSGTSGSGSFTPPVIGLWLGSMYNQTTELGSGGVTIYNNTLILETNVGYVNTAYDYNFAIDPVSYPGGYRIRFISPTFIYYNIYSGGPGSWWLNSSYYYGNDPGLWQVQLTGVNGVGGVIMVDTEFIYLYPGGTPPPTPTPTPTTTPTVTITPTPTPTPYTYTGTVTWDDAGPVAVNTVETYHASYNGDGYVFTNVSSPTTWYNFTTTGPFTSMLLGSITLNEAGTWNVYLTNTTTSPATSLSSDAIDAVGITDTGDIRWMSLPSTVFVGTSQIYNYTMNSATSKYINISVPGGTWRNSTACASCAGYVGVYTTASTTADVVGSWTVYLYNSSMSLSSSTITVSALPTSSSLATVNGGTNILWIGYGYNTITYNFPNPVGDYDLFQAGIYKTTGASTSQWYRLYHEKDEGLDMFGSACLGSHMYGCRWASNQFPFASGDTYRVAVVNTSIKMPSDLGLTHFYSTVNNTLINAKKTVTGGETYLYAYAHNASGWYYIPGSYTPVDIRWWSPTIRITSASATPNPLVDLSEISDSDILSISLVEGSLSGTFYNFPIMWVYCPSGQPAATSCGTTGTGFLPSFDNPDLAYTIVKTGYKPTLAEFIEDYQTAGSVDGLTGYDYLYTKSFWFGYTNYEDLTAPIYSFKNYTFNGVEQDQAANIPEWYMTNPTQNGYAYFVDANGNQITSANLNDVVRVKYSVPADFLLHSYDITGTNQLTIQIRQMDPAGGTDSVSLSGNIVTTVDVNNPQILVTSYTFENLPRAGAAASWSDTGTYVVWTMPTYGAVGDYFEGSSVTVGTNYLSPSGWGSVLGDIFGITNSWGGRTIFGIVVVVLCAVIPRIVLGMTDMRPMMFAGALGALLSYALGLFDLWVIFFIVIIAGAVFVLGYMRTQGGGNEPPPTSGMERE